MTTRHDFFTGEMVRLAPLEPDRDAALIAGWSRDAWYDRLFNSDPAYPASRQPVQNWLEKWLEESHGFLIRTLTDERPVGWMDLSGFDWTSGDCWVGIGLGNRDDWGKGIGTDAMRVICRYAFLALNLRRISLSTFEYNPRAIRSYEKLGFRHEGRARQAMMRDGRCWDILYMGLLRSEWEAQQEKMA